MCGFSPQQQEFQTSLLYVVLTDVLAAALAAYQQGKITKTQYIAVINALDETTVSQNAWRDYSQLILKR